MLSRLIELVTGTAAFGVLGVLLVDPVPFKTVTVPLPTINPGLIKVTFSGAFERLTTWSDVKIGYHQQI